MRRGRLASFVMAVVGCGALVACGGASSSGGPDPAAVAGGTVGVILPDTATSARWESADRVYLSSAFDDAGVGYDIKNAGGNKSAFVQIADDMLNDGVKVLMIANIDSPTAADVIRKAAAAGIPVIDYDRLTIGGGAKYYVSFDNVAVGSAIGQGLVKGMQAAGKPSGTVLELNGSPSDNNAILFAQGYDKAIKGAGYSVGDSQYVPEWDNAKGVTIFEQMLAKAGDQVDGVAAANDGLGGAAVSVLAKKGMAGKVPVTGQDATDEGLQRVLLGTQYVTVYKAIRREAEASAKLAIALIRGDLDGADALAAGTVRDPTTGVYIKAVLLPPKAIYKANVKEVVSDGFTTAARLCTTPDLKAACAANGIS